MSRYARNVDANQSSVVNALRAAGVTVKVTSAVGDGFPDLLCYWRGRTFGLEVKDGAKSPSRRRLTPAESQFARQFPGFVHVVECVEDALAACGFEVLR